MYFASNHTMEHSILEETVVKWDWNNLSCYLKRVLRSAWNRWSRNCHLFYMPIITYLWFLEKNPNGRAIWVPSVHHFFAVVLGRAISIDSIAYHLPTYPFGSVGQAKVAPVWLHMPAPDHSLDRSTCTQFVTVVYYDKRKPENMFTVYGFTFVLQTTRINQQYLIIIFYKLTNEYHFQSYELYL